MLSRALAFLRAVDESCADEVIAVAPGTVLRTTSMQGKWAMNLVRIEGEHLSIGVPEIAAIAAEYLPYASWHWVALDDQRAADRLKDPLRDAGYDAEAALLMGLDREPDRFVDTTAVRAAGLDELGPLQEAWAREEEPEGQIPGLLAAWARQHQARPELRFVIDDEDGRPAAMTLLRWHAKTAQVEDVYTRADQRGRGYARALVTHALMVAREHGHEHVFIAADDEDTPKELYYKLGFSAIGRRLAAVRQGLPSAT